MYAHALETFPEECCGLLIGGAEAGELEVFRCRNEMNLRHRSDPEAFPHAGSEAYWMSEADVIAVLERCEASGERVSAVYHSHVGAAAHLSDVDQAYADREGFPFPGAAHIVISIWERCVSHTAIFERDAASRRFRGRGLVAAVIP
jgi:proteasome lid subunit RPN8/RPN11